MGDKTKIEWTDASWTPIRARNIVTGREGWHCEPASPGCENCYAEGMNKRLGTGLPYKPGHRMDVDILLDERMLLQPLRWQRPRMIFVCSMTDLFGKFVTDAMIDRIFAVMALCPQHTFQVLTKRSDRMQDYCNTAFGRIADLIISMRTDKGGNVPLPHVKLGAPWWPLQNVWLGVSIEDQRRYDERHADLEQTPAAVRYFSIEPLLGSIDIRSSVSVAAHFETQISAATLKPVGTANHGWIPAYNVHTREPIKPLINWVIVGGESGRLARPMHPDWARQIRDQCNAAGVAFFFKQWGEYAPREITRQEYQHPRTERLGESIVDRNGEFTGYARTERVTVMRRVGKKVAGRDLDGQEWNERPWIGKGLVAA